MTAVKFMPPMTPKMVAPFSSGFEGMVAAMETMKPECQVGMAGKSRS